MHANLWTTNTDWAKGENNILQERPPQSTFQMQKKYTLFRITGCMPHANSVLCSGRYGAHIPTRSFGRELASFEDSAVNWTKANKNNQLKMAFHASYTIPQTQAAIISALQKRGLRRSLPRDQSLVIQWAPFSKTAWNRALKGDTLVANILAHRGLGSKSELFRLLRKAAASSKSTNAECGAGVESE